ncbi:velvet factor-domain-containing protein [Blastocladiella britannica]|nr:velvet factor-domain-containing protein [Blastocladiella britannica]
MVDNPDNYPDLLLATALEQLSHDGPSSEDADGPESVTESGRHPQEGPIPTTTGSSDSDHVDASNNLVGTMFSNCHRMNGLDGAMGLFFAFADLSVRAEGRYRLRFELYDLSRADSDDDEPHRLAVVVSNAFSAVGPKKFAGMTEATELSKHLAQQGIKLPVRGETKKGSGRRGGGGGAGVGDADD